MLILQPLHGTGKQGQGGDVGVGNAHLPLHIRIKAAGNAADPLPIPQHLPENGQAGRSRRGQGHLMSIPVKQGDAQFPFQLLNLPTNGRLGHEKLLCRPGEVQLLRHGHKHLNGLHVHDSHPKSIIA